MDEEQEVVNNEEQEVVKIPEEIPASSTLSSLINDLHKTLDDARSVIVQYQQKSNSIDVREKNVLEREVKVDSRLKDVSAREYACKKIEDVQGLATRAQTLMDSANLRLNAAVEAESKLKAVTEEQAGILRESRLQTQKEANLLEVQKRNLDEEVSRRIKKILSDLGITTKAAEVPAA